MGQSYCNQSSDTLNRTELKMMANFFLNKYVRINEQFYNMLLLVSIAKYQIAQHSLLDNQLQALQASVNHTAGVCDAVVLQGCNKLGQLLLVVCRHDNGLVCAACHCDVTEQRGQLVLEHWQRAEDVLVVLDRLQQL